jgi:hypothetical protein
MTNGNEKRTPLVESVVDEVRAIRNKIDESVGHNVKKLSDEPGRKSSEIRKQYGMQEADLSK